MNGQVTTIKEQRLLKEQSQNDASPALRVGAGQRTKPIGGHNSVLLREYLGWLQDEKRCTSLTVYQYAAQLRLLLEFLGDRVPLEAVNDNHLRTWLQRPRRGGITPSAATLAGDTAVLKSFFRYLTTAHRDRFDANPCDLLVTPTVRNRQPKAIEDDLWVHVWTHESLTSAQRTFLGLGFFCGLRRQEICELRPTHLLRGRIVSFVRKGQGEDTFDIEAALGVFMEHLPHLRPELFAHALVELLEERRRRHGVFLLPWGEEEAWAQKLRTAHPVPDGMTHPDQLNKRLKRVLAQTKAPGVFTPHALRHSFVTNMLRAGVDLHVVSTLANHSNVQTTMRYVKTGDSPLRRWHRQRGGGFFSLAELSRNADLGR